MLRTLARLRGKRRKKGKTGDSNSNDLDASADNESISRNSSKNSMSDLAGCDDAASVDDVIEPVPSDEEKEDEEQPKVVKPDTEIRVDDLYDVYNTKHADEDRLFRAEFQSMPAYVASLNPVADYAKLPQNKDKNRYKNVITCDDSRVKLSPIDGDVYSDYINSSFIDGYDVEKKFIAAQGPKENTSEDFWRMIWEYKCYVIVMITELRELGRKKCEQYWPEAETMQFGKIRVQLDDVVDYGSFVERLLKVTHADQDDTSRTIHQFQYRAWPDHGVPKTTSEIFRFRSRALEAQSRCDFTGGPIVVHCSAGVGRTGTFIVLDILIDKLKNDSIIDIYDIIANLRTKRTEMVQSLDQYVFLHKLATEVHLFGNTDVTSEDFLSRYASLESDHGFEKEFTNLSMTCTSNPRLGSGTFPNNVNKNRNQDIIPYEHSQVFIRMRPAEQTPPYANASIVQCYDVKHNMIVTQAPMQNTMEDFWRVVMDNNVKCIVMLCPLKFDDAEYCAEYWPINDCMEIGEIKINNDATQEHDGFVETTLLVSETLVDKTPIKVTFLRHLGWVNEDELPPEGVSVLIKLATMVAEVMSAEAEGMRPRVLVHCSDGAGRSGIFCSIVNILERLKRENAIDIFRSVKDLRDCRPKLVRTKGQYKLCYDVIKHHLTPCNEEQPVTSL